MKPLTEEQLRHTRARLVQRRDELRDRIHRVRQDLRREREPLPRDSADAAIVLENDDVLRAVEDAAGAELTHIDLALERFDAGTFGQCDSCGQPIDPARLSAVPYAYRCGECESGA